MRHAQQVVVFLTLLAAVTVEAAALENTRSVDFDIRGVPQTLRIYDSATRRSNLPSILVLSGDGGWHGFIGELAGHLAEHGYVVMGFDSKQYLASLSKPKALDPAQVTSDIASVARYAQEQAGVKSVVIVGWSEGAGLAVLGGLDPGLRPRLLGVVALGLPELNELAWHTSDAIIYITKKVPNEPTFNSKDYVGRLAPVPLMVIQSTHDAFVPVATAREIFARVQEPKRFVLINAGDHKFEGQRDALWETLNQAFDWFNTLASKPSP